MNRLKILLQVAAVLVVIAGPAAAATAHCHCKVALPQGDKLGSISNIVMDLGDIATYQGINPQNNTNRADCREKCSRAVHDWVQAHKDELCQRLGKTGPGQVQGYSSVGTTDYQVCQTEDYNCCSVAGTLRCPSGWEPDWNGPGNNKCKKAVCTLHDPPFPPNNTSIGNWGFTWGNSIIQWGPATQVVAPTLKACP